MRPHDDRPRVPFSDLDIEVGERGIKSAGVGVGYRTATRERIPRAPAREEEQELLMRRVSKTRSVGGQDNDRAIVAIANQPDAGPNIKSVADVVLPRREENNPLAGRFLNLIDRFLQTSRVVVARWSNVNRLGIFQPSRIERRRPGRRRNGKQKQNRPIDLRFFCELIDGPILAQEVSHFAGIVFWISSIPTSLPRFRL